MNATNGELQAGPQSTLSAKLVVEGVFTAVDIVNGKMQGVLRVTGARAATLQDGGRIVTRERREASPMAPTLGLRNRG